MARDSFASAEAVPLPEGSIARLGRGEIQVMAFSTDGTRLVLGSEYGVWLQDGHTGADLGRLEGTSEGVGLLALSPDGSTLAGGGVGGWLRLWDLASGHWEDSLEWHKGMVVALAFSPDGSLLATAGGKDRRVRLWSVDTGRTVAILAGHRWDILSVAFSPDGSLLASGGRNGEVRLWDVAAGRHQALPHLHKGMVYFLAFSPDGGTLASGDDDTEVRLWDVASAQPGAVLNDGNWRRLPGRRHAGRVLSMTFPPEGGAVVTYGSRYAVRRWEVGSGKRQARVDLAPRERPHGIRGVGGLFPRWEEPGQYRP